VARDNGLPDIVRDGTEAVELIQASPLAEVRRRFLTCIMEGTRPVTHLGEGLAVLRVLETMSAAMLKDKDKALAPCPVRGEPILADVVPPEFGYKVHETAEIHPSATIGSGTQIWNFSRVLRGANIGEHCILGQGVMVGHEVTIGDRCKIQNNVSVYNGVTLEDGVFCGPSCVFTNVLTPRAEIERKSEFLKTPVRRGATIGANATIICGVELGEYSMIGAGAVVTKSVPPYALVAGNPSRQIGWVSAAGERLGPELTCPRTGEQYLLEGEHLVPVKPGQEMTHPGSEAQSGPLKDTPVAAIPSSISRLNR